MQPPGPVHTYMRLGSWKDTDSGIVRPMLWYELRILCCNADFSAIKNVIFTLRIGIQSRRALVTLGLVPYTDSHSDAVDAYPLHYWRVRNRIVTVSVSTVQSCKSWIVVSETPHYLVRDAVGEKA